MTHKLYAVFYTSHDGKAMWGMHRNGRTARQIAKRVAGVLHAMPLPSREARVWDAPTFRHCSDLIADYRS